MGWFTERLILAYDWRPAGAAVRFRDTVDDPLVLRQMAARVRRAIVDRSSEVAERAALTLADATGDARSA